MAKSGEHAVSKSAFEEALNYFKSHTDKKLTKEKFAQRIGVSTSAIDTYCKDKFKLSFSKIIHTHMKGRLGRSPEITLEELTEEICLALSKKIEDASDTSFIFTWDSLSTDLEQFGLQYSRGLLRKKFKQRAKARDFYVASCLQNDHPETFRKISDKNFSNESYEFLKTKGILTTTQNKEESIFDEIDNFEKIRNKEKKITKKYGDEQNLIFLFGATIGIYLSQNEFHTLPENLKAIRSFSNGVDFKLKNGEGLEAKSYLNTSYSQNSNYSSTDHILCWKTGLSNSEIDAFKKEHGIKSIIELETAWKDLGISFPQSIFLGSEQKS